MEADWLRSRLESGRSIESIAREAGKAPSTVAYWVNKHGLTSTHAVKHAARGAIAREVLEELMAEGLDDPRDGRAPGSQLFDRAALAAPVTGSRRRRADGSPRRRRRGRGRETVEADCPVHGVDAVRPARQPWLPVPAVPHRTRSIAAVGRSSGSSSRKPEARARSAGTTALSRRCSSIISIRAKKSFSLAAGGLTRSLQRAREEAAKCVLLCANCHAEVEAGSLLLPRPGPAD